MTYFLKTPCSGCAKAQKCVDAVILGGAVSAIHSVGNRRGHLGSGTIDLQCQNFEAVPPQAAG